MDDVPAARQTTHVALHTLGYDNIDYVADGRAALKLLSQHYYRLVLADWDMSPINGLQILQAMRADKRLKRTPFIMAIDRLQKKFVEIARDDGATFYVTKPATSEMIADRIAQVNEADEGRFKLVRVASRPAPSNHARPQAPERARGRASWQSSLRAL